MQRIQAVDTCEVVVIGQDEKLVAMLTVPADDCVGRAVAVAVERVRVGIAFVPSLRGLTAGDEVGASFEREGGNEERRNDRA